MDIIKEKLKIIPKKPGCYLWKNIKGEIIYVGKAKNLFNRTHSYFNKSHNLRTQKMVSEIVDVDYVIVNNENESLILESNLIYKHQPYYNVLLKENNQYPYLFLTNELKPRLIYTRRKIKEIDGKYFGPFASSESRPHELYRLLQKILPIQNCRHSWNVECFKCEVLKRIKIPIFENIPQNFHNLKKLLTQIFNGEISELKQYLITKENEAKSKLEFEDAARYLSLQKALEEVSNSQYVQINKSNINIIGFASNLNEIAIVILSFLDGKLLLKHEKVIEYIEDWKEQFISYLFQYYSIYKKPKEVFISYKDDDIKDLENILKIKFTIPQRGMMMDLLATAFENAEQSLVKNLPILKAKNKKIIDALQAFEKLLKFQPIKLIEIFDVSQLFGVDKVGAMVVYENGIPNKKKYRKFVIKTQNISSDIDCMKEILIRRYGQLLNKPSYHLPDVLILDGGIAHYNLANKCLEILGLENKIKVCSLVKNEKHRTRSLIYDGEEIDLSENRELIYFLTNIQDEVHRFAINLFRRKNIQSQLATFIKSVKGIGPKKYQILIQKYSNIHNLKLTSVEELAQILTMPVAKELVEKLNKLDQKNLLLNKNIKEN